MNDTLITFVIACSLIFSCKCFPLVLQESLPFSKSSQLILISGCTGTGKSTFGMEVAISRGVLKCISTDTIRQVMRINEIYKGNDALHRSSYMGSNDAITNWLESCNILQSGINAIVDDSIKRGTSLVLEGVHIVPDNRIIDKWVAAGGIAMGVVLAIPDPETHKKVIFHRGVKTGKGADEQVNKFNRIRVIHDEMVRLGNQHGWLILKQDPIIDPRPIDVLQKHMFQQYDFD